MTQGWGKRRQRSRCPLCRVGEGGGTRQRGGFREENRRTLIGIGGRYKIRTCDPFDVNEVRYHCANRPCFREKKYTPGGLRCQQARPGAGTLERERAVEGAVLVAARPGVAAGA